MKTLELKTFIKKIISENLNTGLKENLLSNWKYACKKIFDGEPEVSIKVKDNLSNILQNGKIIEIDIVIHETNIRPDWTRIGGNVNKDMQDDESDDQILVNINVKLNTTFQYEKKYPVTLELNIGETSYTAVNPTGMFSIDDITNLKSIHNLISTCINKFHKKYCYTSDCEMCV